MTKREADLFEVVTGRRLRRHSKHPDWHDEILNQIRLFRTRAILRGALQRESVTDWIASIKDEVQQEQAMNALGRRGILSSVGLVPLKGGLLVPAQGEQRSLLIAYWCTGCLQYCLETAVCVHEGYQVYPEFDSIHIAKGHTGALKRLTFGKVVGHTLRKDSLLESKSRESEQLMSKGSIVAHFFAKRSSYSLDDILHLLVRWWRRGYYEQLELEEAAARFGMSNVMAPYIQMLRFVPRKTIADKAGF